MAQARFCNVAEHRHIARGVVVREPARTKKSRVPASSYRTIGAAKLADALNL